MARGISRTGEIIDLARSSSASCASTETRAGEAGQSARRALAAHWHQRRTSSPTACCTGARPKLNANRLKTELQAKGPRRGRGARGGRAAARHRAQTRARGVWRRKFSSGAAGRRRRARASRCASWLRGFFRRGRSGRRSGRGRELDADGSAACTVGVRSHGGRNSFGQPGPNAPRSRRSCFGHRDLLSKYGFYTRSAEATTWTARSRILIPLVRGPGDHRDDGAVRGAMPTEADPQPADWAHSIGAACCWPSHCWQASAEWLPACHCPSDRLSS